MTDRTPTNVKNLDGYGLSPLPWSRARDLLEPGPGNSGATFFLSTTRPDGRPHTAGVGAGWHDGALFFSSGPGTRKSRNLAADPACVVSVSLEGLDIVLEGEAWIEHDLTVLEDVAAMSRDRGWPVEVENGRLVAPFSAPSAGPPPWDLYRFTPRTVFGVASAEPFGATRWTFD